MEENIMDSESETLTPWGVQSNRIQSVNGKAAALYGGAEQGTHNGAVFDTRQVVYSFDSKASNSMKSANPYSGCRQVEIAKCLDTIVPDPSKNQGGIAIYDMTHADEVMRPVNGDKSNCLNSRMGTGENQVPVVHTIAGNIIGRDNKNGGHQLGIGQDVSPTLNTVDRHAVAIGIDQQGGKGQANYAIEKSPTLAAESHGTPHAVCYSMGHDERSAQPPIVGALCARDYKGVGNQFVDEGKIVVGSLCAHDGRDFNGQDVEQNKVVYPTGKVRRLTPTECERLQGLPDGYTDIEFKGKPASDARRYKAIGNGMAQPCADFVLKQIVKFQRVR